jgi:hypothetical protein
MIRTLLHILISILAMTASALAKDAIRPSPTFPFYWEFRGQTAPLIGGSSEDNLYQTPDVEAELQTLAKAGANYVRCSMSSRDPGNLWPFARDPGTGLYDLTRMDPAFWDRFERFIAVADALDIVVQIEVFDRFDYFRSEWKENPFNPDNNVTYDATASGLGNDYPQHPNAATNPLFRTVPALEDNPTVRRFQEAFVSRILEVTLPRGNVLYCISNETKENAAWGAYWADFIHAAAKAAGTRAYVTEMWDARDLASEEHRRTWGHPETYDYIDISQVNHQVGQAHWDQLIAFRQQIENTGQPRPMNSVKIYGANSGYYGTSRDGQERFWRNLFAGLASARFHRPASGLGCEPLALRNLQAARSLIEQFDFTAASPDAVEIHNRSGNEAYGTGSPASGYAVFFPDGGNVILRTITAQPNTPLQLRWLDIATNQWLPAQAITLDQKSEVRLITPHESGYWVALLQP